MSLVPNLEFMRVEVQSRPGFFERLTYHTQRVVPGCLKFDFLACPTRMSGPS